VPNVVPASTAAMFDLRAENIDSLRRLENRIQNCFRAGALATGCTHEVVQVSPIYAELTPDEWLADAYRHAVTELGRLPMSRAQELREKIGSTDMGNVTRVLPAIHPTIAIDCGDAVNHQFEFANACASASADRAVLEGALAMAWTTIAAATDPEQRDRLLVAAAARGGEA
jgi:metal-dependent amidase/aminoacylase/carboxypeptidase family protein